jgi:polysaccharide deacetylase 2 family uncharacterized protein YibQ
LAIGVLGVAVAAGGVFALRDSGSLRSSLPAVVRVALPPSVPLLPESAPDAAVLPPPMVASVARRTAAPPLQEIPAWRRFAAAAPPFDGRPLIAVVIDDLGLDRRRSARAITLTVPLTLAWLPYAADVIRQAASGRAAGHEILLHAPMQPQGSENPGPNALTVDLSTEEIRRRVAGYLALLPDAVGLNNHMGSRFTRDARAMDAVLLELRARGLLFLDSRTSTSSLAADLAQVEGVPHAVRDVFLDNELTAENVRERLAELEGVARRNGFAVAIGHPHDATLDALEPWLRTVSSRRFSLAPVSAVVRYRLERQVIAARP